MLGAGPGPRCHVRPLLAPASVSCSALGSVHIDTGTPSHISGLMWDPASYNLELLVRVWVDFFSVNIVFNISTLSHESTLSCYQKIIMMIEAKTDSLAAVQCNGGLRDCSGWVKCHCSDREHMTLWHYTTNSNIWCVLSDAIEPQNADSSPWRVFCSLFLQLLHFVGQEAFALSNSIFDGWVINSIMNRLISLFSQGVLMMIMYMSNKVLKQSPAGQILM